MSERNSVESLQDQLNQTSGHLITAAFKAAEAARQQPTNLYRTIIDTAEEGALITLMSRLDGNQSQAAQCMGINRATLRVKLKRHGML